MHRRTLFKAAAVAAVGSQLGGGSAIAAETLPYTADSFFKSRTLGAPIDSAATTAFRNFMATHPDQVKVKYPKLTGVVATNAWGTTFHLGQATDPIWKITATAGRRPETDLLWTQGFHLADAVVDRVPTGTQDRPFLVNDPVFGYSMFCADVVPNKTTRTITVSNSALFWHSSNGLDGRNPRSTDTRNWCSRGRIVDSLCIRGDLIKSAAAVGGDLGHVLQMFFVETNSAAGFCHPMVSQENDQHGWGAEGTRIAILPTVDLVARGFTGAALALARTLQNYGCYLGDNSGNVSTLKGEQASSTYSPYAGTNITQTCLSKLTWNDFYVLPLGWQ